MLAVNRENFIHDRYIYRSFGEVYGGLVCLSLNNYIHWDIHAFIFLSVHSSIHQSVCSYICLYICMDISKIMLLPWLASISTSDGETSSHLLAAWVVFE